MASSCATGGLDWISGKISSLKGLSSIGTGCPAKWLSHHPWRYYLKDVQTWHLGTWFSGGLGSLRLTVGLDDLKALFQPKRFYDPMIPYSFTDTHTQEEVEEERGTSVMCSLRRNSQTRRKQQDENGDEGKPSNCEAFWGEVGCSTLHWEGGKGTNQSYWVPKASCSLCSHNSAQLVTPPCLVYSPFPI